MLTFADGRSLGAGALRAIAVSSDAQAIWVIAHAPGASGDQLLEVPAFDARGPFRARQYTLAVSLPGTST